MIRTLFLAFFLLFTQNMIAEDFVRLTNLPTIYINTFNNVSITDKNNYVYATMNYVDEDDNVITYDSLQIRGRGNSTWGLPKKPYRIKFKNKEKFLGKGYAKARSWTLLANAADKSLMRNAVTSLMGEFTTLKFNPAAKFVDLVLNGDFLGNYQISDQVEVRPHRVNITEQDLPLADTSDISGGYLLEVDGFNDGNCFTTYQYNVPIRIHYPDEEDIVKEQNEYISKYVREFESVLAGNDFADAEKGYRQWVDSVSLADWYICTELSANIDGFWSTYFYKDQGDPRLFWGPLWDFDIAYNNDYRKTGTVNTLMADNGFGQTRLWMVRMWEDPWFARLIHRRYSELLNAGIVEHLIDKIDSLDNLLQESQERNYEKWGINRRMYNEIVLYSSYDQYVNDLRNFILDHADWLETAFENRLPEVPTDPEEPDVPDNPTQPFVPENYYYRITNAGTSKAIDTYNGTIVQYTVTDARETQEWYVKSVGEYFQLINRNDNLALNDPTEGEVGPTTNVGTALNLSQPDENDFRQLWSIVPQGNAGYYNLLNLYTQHVANLGGGLFDDYASILSHNNDERNSISNNRLWKFQTTDELPEDIVTQITQVEPEEYAVAYNPHSQILHFGSETPDNLQFLVSVYTANGQKIAAFRAADGYDMSQAPSGNYIVVWKVGDRLRSVKLVR